MELTTCIDCPSVVGPQSPWSGSTPTISPRISSNPVHSLQFEGEENSPPTMDRCLPISHSRSHRTRRQRRQRSQSQASDDGAKKIAPSEYFEQSSRWSRQSREGGEEWAKKIAHSGPSPSGSTSQRERYGIQWFAARLNTDSQSA